MKVMCINTSKTYPNVSLGEVLEYVCDHPTNDNFFELKNVWGAQMFYPKKNFQTPQTSRHDKLTELGI